LHKPLQNKELSGAAFRSRNLYFQSVSAEGVHFFGAAQFDKREALACAQDLEKTGGFQPVGAVDLGHSGYETTAPCIID
jgi:hypothetical protein